MSTKTKEALTIARSVMGKELEKLDSKLIERAVKAEEPTLEDLHVAFRARLHKVSVGMTVRVASIRREAMRARRSSGSPSDIVEAIIEDQNNSK